MAQQRFISAGKTAAIQCPRWLSFPRPSRVNPTMEDVKAPHLDSEIDHSPAQAHGEQLAAGHGAMLAIRKRSYCQFALRAAFARCPDSGGAGS